ncbi:hypothetical protein ACTQ1O_06490 [Bilifractor sp. LCP21S3_A7]|uniref:hypothetical protein n=1 Tax=Bilifractor sp. LCP21S3_A7 TaxID=3438738 RepID=UPI003F923490
MPKARAGWKRGEYKLENHEFYMALHFALQYNKWVDRYNAIADTSKAITYDTDRVQTSPNPDEVENTAIELAELKENINAVEETAKAADPCIWMYILKAATNEGITYNYLKNVMMIPCSRNYYYDRRHKFYYLLSKKIKVKT